MDKCELTDDNHTEDPDYIINDLSSDLLIKTNSILSFETKRGFFGFRIIVKDKQLRLL